VEDFNRFIRTLQLLPLDPSRLPEYKRALALKRVIDGEETRLVAHDLRISPAWLSRTLEQLRDVGLRALLPDFTDPFTDPAAAEPHRLGIAQMLLGTLTEHHFEQQAAQITGGGRLHIEDLVRMRSDTDYRLKNGSGNPLCRMNIKLQGSTFRQASDLVGIDPDDCFALATYKIYGALRRQEEEALPYIFLVLKVPGLAAASVAPSIPHDFVWLAGVLAGRRLVEDAIAKKLGGPEYEEQFHMVWERITQGEFRILSARRAFKLLTDRLFDRVFALRVRGFTRSYGRAEIDMHFSMSQELTPLPVFLQMLTQTLYALNVRLDRGEI